MKQAGADALVLFNRFYQPDFDINELVITHDLQYSESNEIRLPLMGSPFCTERSISPWRHYRRAERNRSDQVHTGWRRCGDDGILLYRTEYLICVP